MGLLSSPFHHQRDRRQPGQEPGSSSVVLLSSSPSSSAAEAMHAPSSSSSSTSTKKSRRPKLFSSSPSSSSSSPAPRTSERRKDQESTQDNNDNDDSRLAYVARAETTQQSSFSPLNPSRSPISVTSPTNASASASVSSTSGRGGAGLLPPIQDDALLSPSLSPSSPSSRSLSKSKSNSSSPQRSPLLASSTSGSFFSSSSPLLRSSQEQEQDTTAHTKGGSEMIMLAPPRPAFLSSSSSTSSGVSVSASGSGSGSSSFASGSFDHLLASPFSGGYRSLNASSSSFESGVSALTSGPAPATAAGMSNSGVPSASPLAMQVPAAADPKENIPDGEDARGRGKSFGRKEGLGTLKRFSSKFFKQSSSSPAGSKGEAVPPLPLPLRSQSQSTSTSASMTMMTSSSNNSASDHSTSPPLTPQTPSSLIPTGGGLGLPSLTLPFLFEKKDATSTNGGGALLSLSEMLPQLPPLSISPPTRSERSPISPMNGLEKLPSPGSLQQQQPRGSRVAAAPVTPQQNAASSTQQRALADESEFLGDSDLLRAVLNFGLQSPPPSAPATISARYSGPATLPPRSASLSGNLNDLSFTSSHSSYSTSGSSSWDVRALSGGPRRLTEADVKAIEQQEKEQRDFMTRITRRRGIFKGDEDDSEDDYGAEENDDGSPSYRTAATSPRESMISSEGGGRANEFPSSFARLRGKPTAAASKSNDSSPGGSEAPGLDTPAKRALYTCTLLKVHPSLVSAVKEWCPEVAENLHSVQSNEELRFPRSMCLSTQLQSHESTYAVQRNLKVALGRSTVMRKLKRETLPIEQEVEISWFQRRYGSQLVPQEAVAAAFTSRVHAKPEALARPMIVADDDQVKTSDERVEATGLAAWARRPAFTQRAVMWTMEEKEPSAVRTGKAAPVVLSDRICALTRVSNTNLFANAPSPQRFRKRESVVSGARPVASATRAKGPNAFLKAIGGGKSASASSDSSSKGLATSPNASPAARKASAPWLAPRDPEALAKRISRQQTAPPAPRSPIGVATQVDDTEEKGGKAAFRQGHQRSASVPSVSESTKQVGGSWSPTSSDDESEEEIPLAVLRSHQTQRPSLPAPAKPSVLASSPLASSPREMTRPLPQELTPQQVQREAQRRQQAELDARIAHEVRARQQREEERLLAKNRQELKEARERRRMNARESLLAEANYGAGDASRPRPSSIRKSKSSTNVAGAVPGVAAPSALPGTASKRDSMLLSPNKEYKRQSRQPSAEEVLISPKSHAPPRSRSFISPSQLSPYHHPGMVAAPQPDIPWQYHQQRLQPGFMPQVPIQVQPVMMPTMQTPQLHRSSSYAPHLSAAFNLPHAGAFPVQGGHLEKMGLIQLHAHDIPRSATQPLR